jgi:hypothetical protein
MSATNGNGRHHGGAIAALGDKLIKVLPPAFLLLIIINMLFLGAIYYVVQHNLDQRNILLTKIVEQCLLERMPK